MTTELRQQQLELVLERHAQEPLVRPIARGDVLVIGRAPDCSVSLDDPSISRQHARLDVGVNDLLVTDTSTNGTLVDGTVLRRAAVRVAFDRPIALGASMLRVRPCAVVRRPAAHTPAGSAPRVAAAANGGGVARQVDAVNHQDGLVASAHGSVSSVRSSRPVAEQRRVLAGESLGGARGSHADRTESVSSSPDGAMPVGLPAAIADAADSGAPIELRREVHRMLLEHLDMNAIDPTRSDDPALRPRVLAALRRIARMLDARLPEGLSRDALVGEVADEALGLGPLERLLADPSVSEIMVVDAHHIFVERAGQLTLSGSRFTDEERVRAAIERIVTPLGRRVDESSPLVDARLPDGSRVNVVIRPLALRGSCITIRKFARTPITMPKLLQLGALSEAMAKFLTRSVRAKKNVLISGGTGSGKTTLLNVLSAAIPEHERIVTIEDAAELQLMQPHVVSLESRPANMEGKGEVAIRELVKNALRMRPDRIVVGECRGGEALDMLQAMNTGHDGSLTTTHANSPEEALMRIETLTLMAGVALPPRAIREQIAKSLHLIVQQTRLLDGTRKVTAISETAGIERDGTLRLRPLFEYNISGIAADGCVDGRFEPTGYLPSFLPELVRLGLMKRGEALL